MGDLTATLATFLQSQTATNEKLAAAQDRMSTAQAELTATVQSLANRVDQVVASDHTSSRCPKPCDSPECQGLYKSFEHAPSCRRNPANWPSPGPSRQPPQRRPAPRPGAHAAHHVPWTPNRVPWGDRMDTDDSELIEQAANEAGTRAQPPPPRAPPRPTIQSTTVPQRG